MALRMARPSVHTSTTSPVVAAPRCQSETTQASSAMVSTTVTPGMGQPQLFQIAQAASPRRDFPADRGIEPVVFMAEAAKGAHQRHVADDVDHLAVDGGGLAGKIVMQGFAGGRKAEHGQAP